MNTKGIVLTVGLLLAAARPLPAQSILFDFDNAPLYSPLPITLNIGGVTAHLSATGQGYSIQGVSTAPVVPSGFTGRFIYPSSINASDLLISFSTPLKAFSIQYAPQELACDSSATMRVTAYTDSAWIGTVTTNAVAGTWPVETLAINPGQEFNNVVVHYDKPPVTGGDYGTIFIADNMIVTPAPPPIVFGQAEWLAGGVFRFGFTNSPGASFTVLGTTNLVSPTVSWTILGSATEISAGRYQFSDNGAMAGSLRFYRVRSP